MKKNEPSIQQQINQLEELVSWFEHDDFEVEKASDKLKQAAQLVDQIERKLTHISNEVVEIKRSFNNES